MLLSRRAWLAAAACLLAFGLPRIGRSQTPPQGQTPQAGMPAPSLSSAAALNAALAELDRAPNTIVAEVGKRTVSWGDVADVIRTWPQIVAGAQFQQLYQAAAMQVIQQRALAQGAEDAGINKDPAVQRRIKNAIDDTLAQEMLRRSLEQNISAKSLQAVYDGVVAGKPGPEQAHVHIIVTDTQAEAEDLIYRLQQGASFADTARQLSKDGSAPNGGDIGFATVDMLSPEIGAVAFSLGVGQMTAYPVKSANHWFIVKVDERRQGGTPSFSDAKVGLEKDVLHAGVSELRKQALKMVPVTYYGLTGKPEQH
jgi:peptidyl-prolyl cis-trans isomerase C